MHSDPLSHMVITSTMLQTILCYAHDLSLEPLGRCKVCNGGPFGEFTVGVHSM